MTESNNNTLEQLLKDSFSYAISKLIPGVAGLISVILFFKWVGPTEYGQYSIIFSFSNLLAAFSFGWLNQSILRYGSTFDNNFNLVRPLTIGFIMGFVFIFIILSILYQLEFPIQFSFMAALTFAGSIGLFNQYKIWFQSKELPKRVVYLTTLQSVLMLGCAYGAISIYGPKGMSLIMGVSLGYLIPCIPIAGYVKINKIWTDNNKRIVKKFFNFGGPLSLWFGLSLSLNFLDRYFIEYYYGASLMGSFAGFSEFVIRIFSILIFPITLAIHPKIMNHWNQEKNASKSINLLRQGGLLQITIFAVILTAVIMFKASLFLIIEKWVPGLDISIKSLFIPLIIGGFLWQFALMAHKPLEIKEETMTMVLCISIAVGINLIGNVYFLPRYGIIATAYTMITSASIYIVLSLIYSKSILSKAVKG